MEAVKGGGDAAMKVVTACLFSREESEPASPSGGSDVSGAACVGSFPDVARSSCRSLVKKPANVVGFRFRFPSVIGRDVGSPW